MEFLLNRELILAAYIIFLLIILIVTIADCLNKIIPDVVEWIFTIAIIEIVVIALSATIDYVDHMVLYISLISILMCMIFLIAFGAKINLDFLPVFVLIVFCSNILLIILILVLSIITRFSPDFNAIAFFIVVCCAYPILIMNTLYVSMLINHDRYEIKKLTHCLKPVLYIYGIFGAFVWFTLNLSILILEM
ncbi:uncharacterized protein ACRADG_010493 [Cochliomyia hominivorax]